MTKEYRGRYAIIAQILTTINESDTGVSRTAIMYNCFLSYTQLREYLAYLVEKDLINEFPEQFKSSGNEKFAYKITDNQGNVAFVWVAKNWSGACDELAKIAKPTLVITGTDDNYLVPHGNSLILAGKIPGAWLVQIKDAGHAVMTQYPDEISKILNTFLSTTTPSS